MRKQFVRVYAVLILTVVGLLTGAGALFEVLMTNQNSYQLSLPRVFEQHTLSPDAARVREVSPASVQFPPSVSEKLHSGQIVPVVRGSNQIIYYRMQNEKLLAFGPIRDDSVRWEQADQTFSLIFYMTLALVLLILLFPVGRDILRVQRAAIRFSRVPQTLRLDVKPSSSVYPLAQTLENMSARIVELLQLQRDLSNTVAHEIRTPLSRMEFVLQQITPDIAVRYRQRLQKDIEEINLLVTDYLQYARSQHQQPPLNIQAQSGDVLMRMLNDKFAFYQTRIMIHYDWDDTVCRYDLGLMQVAAQNLIMNALRYAHKDIRVTWRVTSHHCELCVADDGAGLKGKHAALKDAFKQGENGTGDMGFGLGLYITHQIAQQHGGELHISNDDELGGARFTLTWPSGAVG